MKRLIYFLISVILLAVLSYGGAFAQDLSGCYWSANLNKQVCPDGARHTPTHQPPSGSIGGCNKKGDLCWGININPPKRHLPIEVYGGEARHLISQGEITYANMNSYGVFHLNVWSRYYNSSFDCDVNVSRRRYHCVENW